ncbi:hypothetical protein MIN45_P1924 [Methylomarinovum tepidoasis]|uniref:Uncharacterized protein n=1 Tax=Methylomarinovum tepidoasis TaxID=2840183 RepID=A0AAU9CFD8_9GAMM|nr:hypothetical protein [Methylomarinovum sp. IN45]BCX89551.1 hypothetical protein MIN45_P1924 [Methylomarinovum sp. IN45]
MRQRFEHFRRIRLGGKHRFADLEIGSKFATPQYLWEKLDGESALILDVIEQGSCGMLGRRRSFFPWTEVEGVHPQETGGL